MIIKQFNIDNEVLLNLINSKNLHRKYSAYEKRQMVLDYINGFSSLDIQYKYNIKPSTFLEMLHKFKIPVRTNKENSRKYERDSYFFDSIDCEEKAYWLGFMYADGYVTKRNQLGISLSIKDIFHLQKFLNSIKSNAPINTYLSSGYSQSEYGRVLIADDILVNGAISQGVFRNKSNVLKSPKISKELTPHFIRGYFDGDGCITYFCKRSCYRNYAIKILSTDDLLDYVKEAIHVNNIGTIHRYYKRKSSQIVSSIELTGNNQVEKFLKYIYNNATIYLDRKYEKYIDFLKYRNCPS